MFPVTDKSNDMFSVTDDIHSGVSCHVETVVFYVSSRGVTIDLFLLRQIRIWRVA